MISLHSTRKWQAVSVMVSMFALLLCSVPSGAAPVAIKLLHAWDGFREPLVNEMMTEFGKANPNISTEIQVVNNSKLQQTFMAAYAGGIAPDIVMISTANLVSLADQGVFLSLDDLMTKDGLAKNMWFPSELAMGQFAGKTYGLPIRTGGESGNVLYYNKQLFDEAGLNSKRAPATWTELQAYSKKLIRYDGDGLITLNPINDITQGSSNQSTINWLYAGGGQLISNDMRTVQFGSQKAVDTANWVSQFRSQVYRNLGDDKLGNNEFYSGRSAMFFWGSEGFSFVWDQNANFPLGIGPRPKNESSQYVGANTGTWVYAIPATTANKEAAWQLLKWLTVRQESAGWFIRQQGRPSPVVNFNRHPEYLKVNPLMPILGDILGQVAQVPILPIHAELAGTYRDAFKQVAEGKAAAESALPEAATRAQVILDKYWSDKKK